MKKSSIRKNIGVVLLLFLAAQLLYRSCAPFPIVSKHDRTELAYAKIDGCTATLTDSQLSELTALLSSYTATSSRIPPENADHSVGPICQICIELKFYTSTHCTTRTLFLGVNGETSYVTGTGTLSYYGLIQNGNELYQKVCKLLSE